MERPTREQMIEQLFDADFDAARDDASDFISDVILDGYKGLNQLTDDELWEEYQEYFAEREGLFEGQVIK